MGVGVYERDSVILAGKNSTFRAADVKDQQCTTIGVGSGLVAVCVRIGVSGISIWSGGPVPDFTMPVCTGFPGCVC